MNKICTSIEQSKKLIELGIDRKTSDMYYWCGEDLRIGGYKAQDEEYDISAWSLSALLELIRNNYATRYEINVCEGGYYIEFEDFMSELYFDPLDTAFEMVVWLKENGKI